MPKFREITGQFVGYIPDSIDSDIVPDRTPMNGRVVFKPKFTGGVIAFPGLIPPEFAHPRAISARIVDGFVKVEVTVGEGDEQEAVLQPLSLMVTLDDEASQSWSWRAEFDEVLIGGAEEYTAIPSWEFRIPDGAGPIDLTEMVSVTTPPAQPLAKGPRGVGLESITAVDGQLVFEYSDSQSTTIPVPEAVAGPAGVPGPAGADGEEGPAGPQGPAGEIPDLLVSNITDATPTGKNLMLAATEGAARNALGLQVGATAIAGLASELENGVSNSSRVWTPSTIAEYVTGSLEPYASESDLNAADTAIREDPALHPNPTGQGLNYMSFFTSWDSREVEANAWTQGFSVNEDTQEIYVSAYDTVTLEQWIECRDYAGARKWRTESILLPGGSAWSEGAPYFNNDAGELCFIVRVDPGGFIRTYNTVTEVLSASMPVAGITKLFADSNYFYCCDGDPTLGFLTAVHIYTLDSIKAGAPVLVGRVGLDHFGPLAEDNKPQGIAVRDGYIYVSAGKRDTNNDYTGKLDIRVFSPAGRLVSSTLLDKADYYRALDTIKRPGDTIPNTISFENEGVYPLRDGRVAVMNQLHRYIHITVHGTGGAERVLTDGSPLSIDSGWTPVTLSAGVTPFSATQTPEYCREGRMVTVRGIFKGAPADVGTSFALGRIHRGFRPSRDEQFLMPSNGSAYWRGYIETNGNIRIVYYGGGTLSPSTWLPISFTYVADGLAI